MGTGNWVSCLEIREATMSSIVDLLFHVSELLTKSGIVVHKSMVSFSKVKD